MPITDFDYIATRNDIISAAFRIVGAVEAGQSPSADMLAQGVEALQLLVKDWSNKHLFLWSFNLSTVATVAGTEVYTSTLDQAIIGVDKAWVVVDNDDLPLEVVSYSRYLDIQTKEAETGRPQVVAFKPTPEPSLYVWPSPDDVYTIKMQCIFPLEDFDTASGTGDIPARFQKALKYGLADDLFDEYPGPISERQYVNGKATELFIYAKNADMPRETTSEVEGLF